MSEHMYDAIVVGGSLAGAAVAKRLVDAGVDALLIEKQALPRRKTCSGIISPRGHRFLIENFGPLPAETLHKPSAVRGVTFHFPSGVALPMNFDHGPTPHLHRKYSDYWAIKQSGIEVHDNTRLLSLEDWDSHVEIKARRPGEDITYRARYVIGADGPYSNVVASLYPDYAKKIQWFKVKQFIHEIDTCPLDPEYFHFWFDAKLGFYTWSHPREGGQIVGVGYDISDNLTERHDKVVKHLRDVHGVYLSEEVHDREGSVNNFGLSLINKYVFGKGNVLVTGQAAGFLNMIAEGMSCALHSGAIAGESVVEAMRSNRPVQDVYRGMVASEVRRCSDQWNFIKILTDNPHEADFLGTAKKLLTGSQRRSMWLDMVKFLYPWGRFNWGRQMLWQAISRQLRGNYNPKRWL